MNIIYYFELVKYESRKAKQNQVGKARGAENHCHPCLMNILNCQQISELIHREETLVGM